MRPWNPSGPLINTKNKQNKTMKGNVSCMKVSWDNYSLQHCSDVMWWHETSINIPGHWLSSCYSICIHFCCFWWISVSWGVKHQHFIQIIHIVWFILLKENMSAGHYSLYYIIITLIITFLWVYHNMQSATNFHPTNIQQTFQMCVWQVQVVHACAWNKNRLCFVIKSFKHKNRNVITSVWDCCDRIFGSYLELIIMHHWLMQP